MRRKMKIKIQKFIKEVVFLGFYYYQMWWAKESGSEDDIYIFGLGKQLGVVYRDIRESIYDSKVIFFGGSWRE